LAIHECGAVDCQSSAAIALFDSKSRFLNVSDFVVGTRLEVDGVSSMFIDPVKAGCIVLAVRPLHGGPNVTKQYYALDGARVVMARCESAEGECVSSAPRADSKMGPPFPKRGEAEWLNRLASGETVQVLEALDWLAAERPAQSPNGPDLEAKVAHEIRIRIRRNPTARGALVGLGRSENKWLREAARRCWTEVESQGN
jgi:hypothetical protein